MSTSTVYLRVNFVGDRGRLGAAQIRGVQLVTVAGRLRHHSTAQTGAGVEWISLLPNLSVSPANPLLLPSPTLGRRAPAGRT